MKGTRLWSQAGSPLIQGRSRREAPFARDWAVASLVALGAGVGVVVLVLVGQATPASTALVAVLPPAVPGAALGGAVGALTARVFGWHPRWVAGAILGAVFSAGLAFWSVVSLTGILGS